MRCCGIGFIWHLHFHLQYWTSDLVFNCGSYRTNPSTRFIHVTFRPRHCLAFGQISGKYLAHGVVKRHAMSAKWHCTRVVVLGSSHA